MAPSLPRWVVSYCVTRGNRADVKVRGKTVKVAIEKARVKVDGKKLISIRPLNKLAEEIASRTFGKIAHIDSDKNVRRTKPKKLTGRSRQ